MLLTSLIILLQLKAVLKSNSPNDYLPYFLGLCIVWGGYGRKKLKTANTVTDSIHHLIESMSVELLLCQLGWEMRSTGRRLEAPRLVAWDFAVISCSFFMTLLFMIRDKMTSYHRTLPYQSSTQHTQILCATAHCHHTCISTTFIPYQCRLSDKIGSGPWTTNTLKYKGINRCRRVRN